MVSEYNIQNFTEKGVIKITYTLIVYIRVSNSYFIRILQDRLNELLVKWPSDHWKRSPGLNYRVIISLFSLMTFRALLVPSVNLPVISMTISLSLPVTEISKVVLSISTSSLNKQILIGSINCDIESNSSHSSNYFYSN